jgi:hypothetical protein
MTVNNGVAQKLPTMSPLIRPRHLFIPRHRRQLGHVLRQNPSTLQIQNAVLAPELKLAVDAFARGDKQRRTNADAKVALTIVPKEERRLWRATAQSIEPCY